MLVMVRNMVSPKFSVYSFKNSPTVVIEYLSESWWYNHRQDRAALSKGLVPLVRNILLNELRLVSSKSNYCHNALIQFGYFYCKFFDVSIAD